MRCTTVLSSACMSVPCLCFICALRVHDLCVHRCVCVCMLCSWRLHAVYVHGMPIHDFRGALVAQNTNTTFGLKSRAEQLVCLEAVFRGSPCTFLHFIRQ